MAGLSLSLLGPFSGSLDGQPLTGFRTLKVQALLVYLASECRTPQRREALMTLLWPGMPQTSAQANLRQVIYLLGKTIPPAIDQDSSTPIDFLLSDRQTIGINPAYPCQVDVLTFKELLLQVRDHDHTDLLFCQDCAERLRKSVELYQGDFLADFYLSDSNEFEVWAQTNRENLRRSVLDALETLAEIQIRKNDYHQARTFAERQLQIDNLQESAYRQIMTAYAFSGRRSESLAIYGTCKSLLAEELGMAPTARTTSLYEKILAGEVSLEENPFAGVRGYELKEKIGSGYYGTVHRAIQTSIGREVAVKVIRPEHANNPQFIRSFEAEAQIVARLEHPHIAPLYDYWREPDRAFLVLRLFRGGSLQSALQAGPWSLEKVARLVEQIAQALDAAHRNGIVHRDIKPANILLDDECNAYLADFGVAVAQGDGWSLIRSTPDSSLHYVSPEQILNDPLTPLTDIYSFGLVLYEALSGEKPFGQSSQAGLLEKQVKESLPMLSGKLGLPARVDAVIQRATAKDPHDRYPDALALAADFRRAASGEESSAEGLPSPPLESGTTDVNPYKGLRSFREEDAADFYGREALVEQLVERLSASRFLAVVGPSGSGKSSVVSAGLIPRLRAGALPGSEKWFITSMIPGPHPFEALEQALLKIAVNPPPSLVEPMLKDERGLLRTLWRILPERQAQLLLVIDQFEELYTLTREDKQRDHFVDSLLAAVAEPGSPLRVVLTLRADFFDKPLNYLPLGDLLRADTVVVLPLSRQELEQVIRRPAEKSGVSLEPGLISVIVSDCTDQPGTLPLLQYALTELFEARRDHTLTHSAYRAMSGIAGALGRRAEDLYQLLDDREQAAVRQIFLRLVTLGEGVEDTRRRVLLAELESLGEGSGWQSGQEDGPSSIVCSETGILEQPLDRFGTYRLLTFDRDPMTRGATVELAHEALLREWPRLRSWLEESREEIRFQRRLFEAATEWQQNGRDEGYLLRGNPLDQFSGWAEKTNLALTEEERAFLDASLQARQARQAAEAERRSREIRLEKRSRAVLRALVGVFAIAAIVALFLSNFAFGQRNLFRTESQARATAQAGLDQERLDAEQQAKVARSRELANQAQLKAANDPELSMLLALEALNTNRTSEAENALRLSLSSSRLERTLYGHSGSINWLRVTPDGKTLVSASGFNNGGAEVWDIASGRLLYTVPGEDVAEQIGNEQLVTFYRDEAKSRILKMVWSLENGKLIDQSVILSSLKDNLALFRVSPDLTRVVLGQGDGQLELWDALSGSLLKSWKAHDLTFNVAFCQDRRMIATISRDDLKVWDIQSGAELFAINASTPSPNASLASFSPNGRLLATDGETAGDAVLWDVEASIQAAEGRSLFTLRGHTSNISAFAFSADGFQLATGAADGTARVWSVKDGQLLFTLSGHQGSVISIVFSPDGKHLFTSDQIGDIRIWDLSQAGSREVSTLLATLFMDLDHSPDGSRFAAVGLDGHLRVWESATDKLLLDLPAHEGYAYEVAFSPDGRQIATTGEDNRTIVWDINKKVQRFAIPGQAEGGYILGNNYQAIAFSPDGTRLATGDAEGMIRLWDALQGDEIVLSHAMSLTWDYPPAIGSLAFSPDGRYLVAAGMSDKALVFDSQTGEKILIVDTDPTIGMSGLSFSPDGTRLAIGHVEGALRVIDFPASLTRGVPVVVFTKYLNKIFEFRAMKTALSPDGHYLATAGLDPVAKVWDAATGEWLFDLPGASGTVMDVNFSPDGKYIRTVSSDGGLRTYVVSTDDLIDLAYSRLTRWWRPEECSQYLHQQACPTPPREITQVDYATSPDQLIGTWQRISVEGEDYLRFQEGGKLVMAHSLAGLDEAQLLQDKYDLDLTILSVQDVECGDQVGTYRPRLVKEPRQPQRLIFGILHDTCTARSDRLGGNYIQIAP